MTDGGNCSSSAVDLSGMGPQERRALFETLSAAAALDAQPQAREQAQEGTKTLLRWLHARLAAPHEPQREEHAQHSGSGGVVVDDIWESTSPATATLAGSGDTTNASVPPSVDDAVSEEIHTEIVKTLTQWCSPAHKPLPLVLWLQWMEIGSCVHVLQCQGGLPSVLPSDELVALMKSVNAPVEFPTSSAHCNAQQQVTFSCSIWDAVMSSAVRYSHVAAQSDLGSVHQQLLNRLLDVFLHWMAQAMRGYETVFIRNVGESLIAHIRRALSRGDSKSLSDASSPSLLQTLQVSVGAKMAGNKWQENVSSIAIMVLLVHALSSPRQLKQVSVVENLESLVVNRLKMDAFPHVHDPHAIVGMALGIAGSSSSLTPSSNSWTSALVQQFALLRSVNVSLLSFKVGTDNGQQHVPALSKALQGTLASIIRSNYDAGMVALSFQMAEACVVEALGFFRSSSACYKSLLQALQSVFPPELFRDVLVKYSNASVDEHAVAIEANALLSYLQTLYAAVSSTLQALTETQPGNSNAVLLAFLTLSKLEFARESCSSRDTNLYMNALTQQVEDAIEKSPEPVLSAILRAVPHRDATSAWTVNADVSASSIPQEVDVISSCQALVVGLIVQRKLRVVLFQSGALMDEALALVFAGLYNGYEPLDAFAHRFLGFCLTHLGQYISIYNIIPHYLQVTLTKYPQNASQESIAKTCGVIFGALYYAASPGTGAAGSALSQSSSTMVSTQQRMILWAMKKCCDRVAELLLAPQVIQSREKRSTKDEEESRELSADESQQQQQDHETKSGLYLAGIIFELMKMGPMELLVQNAMEIELLLSKCSVESSVLEPLKAQLFTSVSQNCDAEKRAWLAAWYVEIANLYSPPLKSSSSEATQSAHSRL